MSLVFACEKWSDVLEEMKLLFPKHWEEVALYRDIELNMDYDRYLRVEALGAIRVFTVRENTILVGYSVYLIQPNMHYKQSLTAVEDIIYILPEKRGSGHLFIKYCDDELRKLKVQVVSHHVKVAHNWGVILERQNYDLHDILYTKRLDR